MSRMFSWLFVFVVSLEGTRTQAEDWLAFRGTAGTGHVPTVRLPTRWSHTENVSWKRAIPGEGWSSPVVIDDRIYLTAAVPGAAAGEYSLRLLCVNANSSQFLFDNEVFRETSAVSIHSKNSHASPTPWIDGDRIYVHFGHEGTACLDLDGKKLWENRSLRYAPRHGAGGSPVLIGKSLIFSCDAETDPFVVALHADTGSVLWRTPRPTEAIQKFSFSTPTEITVDGKVQVVSPGSNMVCAYDPQSGQETWRVRYQGYSVIPKPVFGKGLLFVASGYNTPQLYAIRPGGRGDVTDTHVAWQERRAVPHTPSLLLVGDLLFMVSDSGIASCLEAETGKTFWQERLGGKYSASPIYNQGLIYFQSEEGETSIVKAAREYELIGKNQLPERTLASPAVWKDSLLLRGDKHLYCIRGG